MRERERAFYGLLRRAGDLSRFSADEPRSPGAAAPGDGRRRRRCRRLARCGGEFATAHRITRALLERAVDSPDRIFAHAQSEYRVGFDGLATARSRGGRKVLARLSRAGRSGSPRSSRNGSVADGARLRARQHVRAVDAPARRAGGGARALPQAIGFEQQAVIAIAGQRGNVKYLTNRHGWLADVLVRGRKLRWWRGPSARRPGGFLDGLLAERPEQCGSAVAADMADHRHWRDRAQTRAVRGGGPLAPRCPRSARALAREDPKNVEVAANLIRTLMLTSKARRGEGMATGQPTRRRRARFTRKPAPGGAESCAEKCASCWKRGEVRDDPNDSGKGDRIPFGLGGWWTCRERAAPTTKRRPLPK